MRKKLGEILVAQGAVAPGDVDAVLEQQSSGDPARIGDLLLASGKVTPLQLAKALCEQSGLPFVQLEQVSPEVAALVPIAIQREHCLVPFKEDGPRKAIHVAVADPTTRDVLADLEFQVGRSLKISIAARDEIESVHAALQGDVLEGAIIEDDPPVPAPVRSPQALGKVALKRVAVTPASPVAAAIELPRRAKRPPPVAPPPPPMLTPVEPPKKDDWAVRPAAAAIPKAPSKPMPALDPFSAMPTEQIGGPRDYVPPLSALDADPDLSDTLRGPELEATKVARPSKLAIDPAPLALTPPPPTGSRRKVEVPAPPSAGTGQTAQGDRPPEDSVQWFDGVAEDAPAAVASEWTDGAKPAATAGAADLAPEWTDPARPVTPEPLEGELAAKPPPPTPAVEPLPPVLDADVQEPSVTVPANPLPVDFAEPPPSARGAVQTLQAYPPAQPPTAELFSPAQTLLAYPQHVDLPPPATDAEMFAASPAHNESLEASLFGPELAAEPPPPAASPMPSLDDTISAPLTPSAPAPQPVPSGRDKRVETQLEFAPKPLSIRTTELPTDAEAKPSPRAPVKTDPAWPSEPAPAPPKRTESLEFVPPIEEPPAPPKRTESLEFVPPAESAPRPLRPRPAPPSRPDAPELAPPTVPPATPPSGTPGVAPIEPPKPERAATPPEGTPVVEPEPPPATPPAGTPRVTTPPEGTPVAAVEAPPPPPPSAPSIELPAWMREAAAPPETLAAALASPLALERVVRLLIDKGLITEAELLEELKKQ